MKHKPYNKLKDALRERGITYKNLAEILGISESSISGKINGISDFYIDEVLEIEKKINIGINIYFESDP